MSDEDLRKLLLIGLEYSYLHDDWVNPLEDALAGVTFGQAKWRPGPEGMGIWDIVLHVAVWNENIVERFRTGEKVGPSEGRWPPLPALADDAAWEAAKTRLRNSMALVRDMIERTPASEMNNRAYGLGDLLCRFVHIGYHLGQITKMRESVSDLSG